MVEDPRTVNLVTRNINGAEAAEDTLAALADTMAEIVMVNMVVEADPII